jgi:hypothetical protein
MNDPRDYNLDLSTAASQTPSAPAAPSHRPHISVHFACCNIYLRIYRDAEGKAYRGHCPRCAKPIHFPIGKHGTQARFFRVE